MSFKKLPAFTTAVLLDLDAFPRRRHHRRAVHTMTSLWRQRGRAHDKPLRHDSAGAPHEDVDSAREWRRPRGLRVRERLTDPQSGEGAEQVTAHSKMSQPLHNPCVHFFIVALQLCSHRRRSPALKSLGMVRRSRWQGVRKERTPRHGDTELRCGFMSLL